MPFDQSQAATPATTTAAGSWDAFFESLPFVGPAGSQGRRRFWHDQPGAVLDLTEATPSGTNSGLERGIAWAEQTGTALAASYRRGVLLRILRDMEFESAEAVGFVSQLEEALVAAYSAAAEPASEASGSGATGSGASVLAGKD